jgi:hypothetical protein
MNSAPKGLAKATYALAAALLVAAARPAALMAQTATVSGSLINQESQGPIEGARVSILGTSLAASTDSAGRFELARVPAGVRVLQARAVGYVVASWVVELGEGQVLRQVFAMAPRAVEMAGVTVTAPDARDNWRSEAAFELRRGRGQGFFITREQIRQRNATTITDLLRTVPGVMTNCTGRGCTVTMERSTRPCRPEYFLDGYPATFSTGPNFPIQQIRGVEIYRNRFETPNEFQLPNLSCGVIVLWSIEPGTPLERR